MLEPITALQSTTLVQSAHTLFGSPLDVSKNYFFLSQRVPETVCVRVSVCKRLNANVN